MAYKRHEGSISHLTEKELSPSIPRFFHVLNDAHVLHALRLPSSFAPKVEHLVDQEILLEDLCGQIWPVTLSYVDNALSFALGWEIFYRDHALEGGCSLIFNYVGERHMSVQIYDPSGCERTCFTYPVRQLNNQNCYNVGVEEISEMGSAPRTAAMGCLKERESLFPISIMGLGSRWEVLPRRKWVPPGKEGAPEEEKREEEQEASFAAAAGEAGGGDHAVPAAVVAGEERGEVEMPMLSLPEKEEEEEQNLPQTLLHRRHRRCRRRRREETAAGDLVKI
ncbi:B3 domain-containing protein Os12g0592300-like [Andrographis paniculata]|uniref:B3 domain-containing protein Os12g0592300-like n=1 Tax=Andrographis paniculata TaxID=175694 RepID=UPI0021E8514D|nr:B3 domain-containing protein Os12g0592300-like [Andrographis paniculata]